jgi:NAD(P)-dependent dehydrogenase (short-subunit alcohol dehydrogenase family)
MAKLTDLFDLTDRHALITGASRGIGLAIAHGLGRRGAAITITGRKAESLDAAASQLRAAGAEVRALVCHQGDPSAIANLFSQLDQFGKPADIAVINAATNPVMGSLVDTDLAAWQKILDVNLTGALVTAQQAARRMRVQGSGSLIFMASVAGLDPMPGIAAYSVSKTGVLGLMRALAKELGPAGIRVNAVAPGLVETRFSAALFQDPQRYRQIVDGVPLGRHGQPEDIVGATVYLASAASAYVTGQVLVVDGGMRM